MGLGLRSVWNMPIEFEHLEVWVRVRVRVRVRVSMEHADRG